MDEHERSTPTKRILLAAVTFLLLSGPFSAHANIIYTWIGDCDGIITPANGGGSNGCTGQAAMLVVTTDAYVPGEVFVAGPPPPVLLEALYSDENVAFNFAPFFGGTSPNDSFQLPASPLEGGFVHLEVIEFHSDVSGVWRFSGENVRPGCDPETGGLCGPYRAMGFNGVWTRVPEPSTLALLGVGLAGLAFSRKKRSA
jgi:hypothetical protein